MAAPARRPRTDVIPRAIPLEEREPPAPAAGRRRLHPVVRRVRTTVKHVDPLSVFKLSLCFYSVLLVFWLVLVAVVYSVVSSMGLFTTIHNVGVGMEFKPLTKLDITLGLVERWAALIGVAGVVLGSLLNLFLAFFYNVASDLFGGIEVTLVERDYKG